MRYILFFPLALLFACTPTIDEAPFPQDQQAVRYAFKRMSEHGQIEPVLMDGRQIKDWYFEVLAGDGAQVQRLGDGSGIDYQLDELSAVKVTAIFREGDLLKASGEVSLVKRNYPEGSIIAILNLTSLTSAD